MKNPTVIRSFSVLFASAIALCAAARAKAATIPFTYDADRASAFVMNPNEHKRFGYVTSLAGLGLGNLAPDLTVQSTCSQMTCTALEVGSNDTAKVVGVIETFSWSGGVGDPVEIDFYVSQENAVRLKASQQSAVEPTAISTLGWWIADYDEEAKVWFEQAFPTERQIAGIVGPKNNPELNVDLTPVPAATGIDELVYKVSLKVAPAANHAYALEFQNAANKPTVKAWGLEIGTLAAAALAPSE